jgi:hypothetical protein
MQARYRKLYPRIWQHPDFQLLAADARLVALYLLTGPQTNRLGYYRLSVGEAVEDLRLTPAAFEKAIVAVAKAMDWGWDARARVVWIKSWWAWNRPEAPNNLKGAIKDYFEVPASPLSRGFIEGLRTVAEPLGIGVPNPSRTPLEPVPHPEPLGIGVPNPSRTPLEPLPNPSRTQEQDQEQDQDQEQQQEQEPIPVADGLAVSDRFGEFYALYPASPNNPGPHHAKTAWRKLKPDPALQATIIDAIRRQRDWPHLTKEGGRYVCTPQKWLTEHRWLAPEPPPEKWERTANSKTAGNAAAGRQALALLGGMHS